MFPRRKQLRMRKEHAGQSHSIAIWGNMEATERGKIYFDGDGTTQHLVGTGFIGTETCFCAERSGMASAQTDFEYGNIHSCTIRQTMGMKAWCREHKKQLGFRDSVYYI